MYIKNIVDLNMSVSASLLKHSIEIKCKNQFEMERLIRSACGTKYKKTKRQKTNKYHSKTLEVYEANHNQ